MKARKLKKILNTGRAVHISDNKICVASGLCHDLINIDIKSMKIKYLLDTFHEGKKSLKSEELSGIWDKLQELIDNGQISDILNGNDTIDNPLPVYTIIKGELHSTFTDEYGYPNITIEGYLMYDNEYFKTKKEAVNYGIKEYEYRIASTKERILEKEYDLKKYKTSLDNEEKKLKELRNMDCN